MNYQTYNYSQRDPLWSTVTLGTCSGKTIGTHGCLITFFSNITGYTPQVINEIAKEKDCYINGCNLNSAKLAQVLSVQFDDPVKVTVQPDYPCGGETNYYAKLGVPQHFFLIFPDGMIVDSLDGKYQKNKYANKMVSYRRFKPKVKDMEAIEAWDKMKEIKVFTEYTSKDDIINAEKYAMFTNRLLKYLNK